MTESDGEKGILALYAGDTAALNSLVALLNEQPAIEQVRWQACSSWMEAVALLTGRPDAPGILIVDFTHFWGRPDDIEGYRCFLRAYARAINQAPTRPILGIARHPAEDRVGSMIGIGNLVDFYLVFPGVKADMNELLLRVIELARLRII